MEMISIKSPAEIEKMRAAGRLTAQARKLAGSMVRPGVSTLEIDREVRKFIESHGAKPSFLGYGGFPASTCISVNEVVIHGIPDHRKLKEGDIVSVDVGAYLNGFHGDCAATFFCGEVSAEAKRLVEVTRQHQVDTCIVEQRQEFLFDIYESVPVGNHRRHVYDHYPVRRSLEFLTLKHTLQPFGLFTAVFIKECCA